MEPIQDGLIAGFWLSLLVGPLLVIIVQNTLSKGIIHGYMTVAGIWASDILYIVLSYALLAKITAIQKSAFFTESIGLFGGIIVLIIGVGILLNKPKELDFNEAPPPNGKRDALKSFIQGFSVNTLNPFTLTFWTGSVSATIAHEGWFRTEHIMFLVTVMIVIVCTDSIKVLFANHIRKYISQSLINRINKAAGLLITIIGIYLIIIYLNL